MTCKYSTAYPLATSPHYPRDVEPDNKRRVLYEFAYPRGIEIMETFALKIKTGNAAFHEGEPLAEVARILREVADKLDRSDPAGTIFDANGNSVGEFISA